MQGDPHIPELISVDSLAQAWRRAVDMVGESTTGEILNLIIRVKHPSEELPAELEQYTETIQRRASDLLATEPPDDLPYAHGQRIFRWGSDFPPHLLNEKLFIDQLNEYVIPILRDNPESRRALVNLANPVTDQVRESWNRSIPAPQLIQFDAEDGKLLVTAFYRTHDVYWFWPVNFIELFRLQQQVCERVGDLAPGPITTISHNAHIAIPPTDLDRPTRVTLPIELSELARIPEEQLRALVDQAVGDQEEPKLRLDRLIMEDLDRENTHVLKPEPYSWIASHLRERTGLNSAMYEAAVALEARVRTLGDKIRRNPREDTLASFSDARSYAGRFLDTVSSRAPRKKIILAVVGVNSDVQWLLDLQAQLHEHYPEAVFPAKHSKFGLTDVLLPGRLERRVLEFNDSYNATEEGFKEYELEISVIAHSYGTLILLETAKRFNLKLDKVILVGSIVPRKFDWPEVQFQRLLNEVGGGDRISNYGALACRAVGRPVGRSGSKGFLVSQDVAERVVNVTYKYRKHSDSLDRKHIRDVWIPFLREGRIRTPAGLRHQTDQPS